jgi:hypothetical protein
MAVPSDRDMFMSRCLRVSGLAQSRGVTLRKVEGRHELEVSSPQGSVVFPLVTDERDWRETTVEEAFYAVLLDARAWQSVHVDDATPSLRGELSSELNRISQLETVLGGHDKLQELWDSADLTAA